MLQVTGSLNDVNQSGIITNITNNTLPDILKYLSCELRELQLQINHLKGPMPSSITLLNSLQSLNFGYNGITGT